MTDNKGVYSRTNVAESWYSEVLQQPEVFLFIKYGADISSRRLLDIGCGAGRTSFFLSRVTSQYVGCDYAPAMVDVCRRRFPRARFEVTDVRDMSDFPSDSFDTVVFSFNGLDSIDHDGRIKGLMEIRRVLRSGGLFIFSAHNRGYSNFQDRPSIKLSLNPYRLTRSIAGWWLIDMKNHKKNRSRAISCEEYEIRNDSSHRWQMMHYYIDRRSQQSQLSRLGFHITDTVDWNGRPLSENHDDSHSGTIYYAARKRD